MDYIREEFLRQQEALAELLLGRKKQADLPEEEMAAEILRTAVKVDESNAGVSGYGIASAERTESGKRTVAQTGSGEQADGVFLTAGGLVRARSGQEVTAGMLSRTFQRDARRYDGGFTLY